MQIGAMNQKLIAARIDIRTVASFVLICLGLALSIVLSYWYRDYCMAEQSASWPSIWGDITVAKMERVSAKRCGGKNFKVDIRYTYVVAGESYRDSRLGFGPGSCYTEAGARQVVAMHPIGQTLVWYNPVQPEVSTLKGGAVSDSFWENFYTVLALSSGAFSLAAWFLISMKRESRRQRSY